MLRILLTGGNGMLGTDIVPILSSRFNISAPSSNELDITCNSTVEQVICNGKFDWVIHMAALTDLDWCEENPDVCSKINEEGTKNVSIACAKSNTRLVYISTSGVFSGNKETPYTESDVPKPINVYGKSKYNGELLIQKLLPPENRLILRVGWLFGGGRKKDKKYVGKMFRLMMERDKVLAVSNIFGSPNYSIDIGKTIAELINLNCHGIFHIANSGEPASRYDMALVIREAASARTVIEPASNTQFPTKAPRPKMEAITSLFLNDYLKTPIKHWRIALEEYVYRLRKEYGQ